MGSQRVGRNWVIYTFTFHFNEKHVWASPPHSSSSTWGNWWIWVSLLWSRHPGMRKGDLTHPESLEGAQRAREWVSNCGVEERSPYRGGMGEVVESSLRSLCFKCEETKVPGGLWLSDVNQQESILLFFQSQYHLWLFALRPHGLQHARLPCPSPSPGVYSNSCPLSWCCGPAISSSVAPFSSCLQSCPAAGSFQWLSLSHQVARVLELQLQHPSNEYLGLVS